MRTEKRRGSALCCSIAFLGLLLLFVIGLTGKPSSLSRADAPNPYRPAEPQAAQREFIVLPEANSVAIQNLLTTTAQITVTLRLADGVPSESNELELLPESLYVYTGPSNFSGSGEIEAIADVPDTVDPLPIFAANYRLSDRANVAYMGNRFEGGSSLSTITTTQIIVPHVVKAHNGMYSYFVLRNLAPEQVYFQSRFYDRAGSLLGEDVRKLQGYGSVIWHTVQEFLPAGYVGYVILRATGPLEIPSSVVTGGLDASGAYRAGDREMIGQILVAPALFNTMDYQWSELCVLSLAESDMRVAVRYSDGQLVVRDILTRSLHCFDQRKEEHASGWAGGATIVGGGPMLAVVNVMASEMASEEDAVYGRWSYAVPSLGQLGLAGEPATVALPFLFNNWQDWATTIHIYNPSVTPAVVQPRYVSEDGFVYCGEEIDLPGLGWAAISQAELPAFMDVSMGYLTATHPVAAAVSGTTSKNLGDTDRHFGYGAAYPANMTTPQNPCDTIQWSYLPIVQRWGP